MTREEKIICKDFLNDADKTHSCNEYKLLMALLEKDSTIKNDLGVDCISRQFMCELGANCIATRNGNGKLIALATIEELPPATPIRPKGHWICDGKGRSFADYHCSECGLKLALCGQDIKQRQDNGYSLFCGGCGADMREVEE